jgi:hypothetical protein
MGWRNLDVFPFGSDFGRSGEDLGGLIPQRRQGKYTKRKIMVSE